MAEKKIKVARIIARLNIGGPAIQSILLTAGLSDEKFESILICGQVENSEKDMLYLAKDKGVKPVIIPQLGRRIDLVKDFIAFIKICGIILKFRPDIVHTHTAKAGALGRTAAILAGVPVRIHTFHGHIFEGYFNKFQVGVFLFIERMLAFFSKYIIVVSQAQRSDIAIKYRIVKEDKIIVVPLGLELERFSSIRQRQGGLRDELKIGADSIVIAIIGRLVPVKNHRMFLDAAYELCSKHLGWEIKFIVVGDGEERPLLEKYCTERGLNEKVIFYGWKKDIAEIFADVDIVALTSFNEGTPVALIEALASARPVVSTDVGGVRDVVVDGLNGYLVRSGDHKGFAEKLSVLVCDREKREIFGKNGRAAVLKKYSKERLVEDIRRIYAGAISGTE